MNNHRPAFRNRGMGYAGYGDDFRGISAQFRALRKRREPRQVRERTPLMAALLRQRGII